MDLSTKYLGLDLKHPVIASASPLSADLDGVLRLADAGAAAIVMASIYEEQITEEEMREAFLLEQGAEAQPEATGYFPPDLQGDVLEGRLTLLRRAAERAGVPVIASLNGCSEAGWVKFAAKLEQAGAAAIELNLYRIPADLEESGAALEDSYARILKSVKAVVNIPVSVKVMPFFSAPGNMLLKLVRAGADGLVLFNRFYEPGIDPASLRVMETLHLSTSYEMRLPLMWTGLASSRLQTSIAASTGVWNGTDVAKYLLTGADAVMTASALLRHGPDHIGKLLEGLRHWMTQRGFAKISDFHGKLAVKDEAGDAEAFLRAQYRTILTSYFP
ncbi:dihydroorotate dehydrogenase-like protein [Acidocella sp.]|uniref:dihydroorotate dehydrogenase-like protein n=1 Tax=Acidocella sp. TaxID=50710 RepID=UPI003D01CB5F